MTTPKAASQETKAVMSLESVTRDYRQGDEIVHALRSTDLTFAPVSSSGFWGRPVLENRRC